jgi:hypothetical protein
MDLYPFNLVLAVTIGSATLFFGYLPIRRLENEFFLRQILRFGAGWLAVAACSSPEILHYDILLTLLCFIAWWRLRTGHGLSGKYWFLAAAGLGISLGPVLILAVRTEGMPGPLWLHLILLYLGGSVSGLAWVLSIFTRPAASEARLAVSPLVRLLVGLVLLRAAGFLAVFLIPKAGFVEPWKREPYLVEFLAGITVLVLPLLASWAAGKCRSPRPSTAGFPLLALGVLAFGAECATCWL